MKSKTYTEKQMDRLLLQDPESATIKADLNSNVFMDAIPCKKEIIISWISNSNKYQCLGVFKMNDLVAANLFYEQKRQELDMRRR